MSSCVCVGSRSRMRKYVALLFTVMLVACGDLGPDDQGRGKIVGTITEETTGESVGGAEITINTSETTQFATVVGGTYEATRLVPGGYIVTIDPPSGFELADGTLNDVPVQIVADETRTVNFLLRVRNP
jgi:hypothetical protein